MINHNPFLALHFECNFQFIFVILLLIFCFSEKMSTRQSSSNDGAGSSRFMLEITRNIPATTNPFGAWSTAQHLWYVHFDFKPFLIWFTFTQIDNNLILYGKTHRWHPRSIHGFTAIIRIRWLSAHKLFVLGRLCR